MEGISASSGRCHSRFHQHSSRLAWPAMRTWRPSRRNRVLRPRHVQAAIDPKISPYRAWNHRSLRRSFSNRKVDGSTIALPNCCSRSRRMAVQAHPEERALRDRRTSKPFPEMKRYNVRDAVFGRWFTASIDRPSLRSAGKPRLGGVRLLPRLTSCSVPSLVQQPHHEAAIVVPRSGRAGGGRVVAELMYCGFLVAPVTSVQPALKWRAQSGGVLKMPVVLRISVGFKYGAASGLVVPGQPYPGAEGRLSVLPMTPEPAERGTGGDRPGRLPRKPDDLAGRAVPRGSVPAGCYESDQRPGCQEGGKGPPPSSPSGRSLSGLGHRHWPTMASTAVIDLRSINPWYDKLVAV